MRMKERIHLLAIELHEWMENSDFTINPEPSVEQIERVITEHLGLDVGEKLTGSAGQQANPDAFNKA